MSVEVKLKKKQKKNNAELEEDDDKTQICELDDITNLYSKKCGKNNKDQLQIELENRQELELNPNNNPYLYPTLDDPNFIINMNYFHNKHLLETFYRFKHHTIVCYYFMV